MLASLKLSKADLYDDSRGYTYTYLDGAHVHRSYSNDGKKRFYQSGHNTNGAPTTLYRVNSVQLAVQGGVTVWMVEGENDVHALETLHATATTNRGGVGMFGKCDLSPLYGAHVKAVVDRDAAGDKWARMLHTMLTGKARSLTFVQAKEGKDAADHIAADHTLDGFQPYTFPADDPPEQDHETRRKLVVTRASAIKSKRVKWLEEGRLALGTLALLAGREGLGKSTLAYERSARITRGELEGEFHGQPKGVLVCATEDSWEHTIVPRLMATTQTWTECCG